MMLFFVGAVCWVFAVTAMTLHKLTELRVIEIVCWAVTFGAMLWFEFLLHR
ncbi:hypothetical protein KGQ34_02810 [Patescibacteria group bacterium]|nr:hypothetical protein [Patescibacteria group bacterium]